MRQSLSAIPSAPSELWKFILRERVVLLLLGATFALLAWERCGMERVVVLEPGSPLVRPSIIDDASEGGGSVCRLETDSAGWWLDYDVRPGPSWAFCGLGISFVKGDSEITLDLSGFDTLVVNMLGMEGPNRRFQTQILSFDPRLEREAGVHSLKYHDMIFSPPNSGASRIAMPLDYFVIPPWWSGRNQVPARNLDPTRKQVREIEVMTSADKIVLGTGRFGIRNLELHGKWIRRDALLEAVLVVWLLYIGGGVGWRLYQSVRAVRELRAQTDRWKELSERDPLTLLYNRRGIQSHLAILGAGRTGPVESRLGLMMVDLDHFKETNDRLGHDAGDQILRLLAGILQEEMRPRNIAARWGGEEFILLLPGIPLERLQIAAERIRTRIESELRCDGTSVTASIGAAIGRADDFEGLVKRADDALYRAKTNGRNRVEMAS